MDPNAFDLRWFLKLNALAANPSFKFPIIFLSDYFSYLIVIALLLFPAATLLRRLRHLRGEYLKLSISALVAAGVARLAVAEIVRFFYYRPRPFAVLGAAHQLIPESGGSFPSGHAIFFFALAAAVWFHRPRVSILFFVAAALLSLARVAAGVHWPTDIIAGAILGVLTAALVEWEFRRSRFGAGFSE